MNRLGRAPFFTRLRTMASLGLSMMFFDKTKLVGTVLGVVFAVVLTNQQIGIFLGLLDRNTMFVTHAGADLWILPPATKNLGPGARSPRAPSTRRRPRPGWRGRSPSSGEGPA